MAVKNNETEYTIRPTYTGPDRERFDRATLQNSSPSFDEMSKEHFEHTMSTMKDSAERFARLAATIDAKE